MSTSQQSMSALEKEIASLKDLYASAMQAYLKTPQDPAHITKRREVMQMWHAAGLKFFNAFEQLIASGSLSGADKDRTWYTHQAETAANLLETIEKHYRAVFGAAEDLRLPRDMFKPSSRAYSNMQRLVKETDVEHALLLRAQFIATGIPTHGFDNEGTVKPGTSGIEKRFFVVGCVFAAAALCAGAWGFYLEDMRPHQYWILRWLLSIASAFASGSFAGSLTTGSKRFWWGIAVAATGGFGVWFLSNLFLLKA